MEHGMDFALVKAYFNLSPEGLDEPVLTMPARDLLRPEAAREALLKGGELSQAIGLALPASYIGLSFFGLVATKLLLAAQYDRLLDLSLDNLTFQLEARGGYANLGYKINDVRWVDMPAPGEGRESFLLRELTDYFGHSINPAIRSVADSAGEKPQMIWFQFGARNAYMQEYMSENEARPHVLDRYRQDNRVLTELLPPGVFDLRRNPFRHKPRYVDSPYRPGTKIMLRSSCCMYDCRVNGEKCYNCPRLTEEQRAARYDDILAQSAT